MDRARAEFMELQEMQFGAVTFMLAERILWEPRAKVTHHSIARDLGDHAGGGDAHTDAITIDDCLLRQRKQHNRQTVDYNMIRMFDQSYDYTAYCLMLRSQND